jgi:hypothetical protein
VSADDDDLPPSEWALQALRRAGSTNPAKLWFPGHMKHKLIARIEPRPGSSALSHGRLQQSRIAVRGAMFAAFVSVAGGSGSELSRWGFGASNLLFPATPCALGGGYRNR